VTKIEWDQSSDKIYQVGLDRGTLYLDDDLVVPWNGLVSVEQDGAGTTTEPIFFDGKKYGDLQEKGTLEVEIKALTYPEEFAPYNGVLEAENGLNINNQPRKPFSMSFRTLVGDGLSDTDLGYRIHILYNLTATLDTINNKTIGDNFEPMEFSWAATTKEEVVPGYIPTAYVVADTRFMEPGSLLWIEYILWGAESVSPYLPDLESLIEILDNSFVVSFTDNGDVTWTAQGPDENFSFPTSTTFAITNVNATYSDAYTYSVSST